jgi:phosphoglycolate phosphatase
MPAERFFGEIERSWPLSVGGVLIDLDGTLIHTGPDLARAVNLMMRDLGRRGYPEEKVLNWVGNGAVTLIHRALTGSRDGQADPDLYERGHDSFHHHYLEGVCEHSEPYPDVVEALKTLSDQGFRLACVTNKPERFTCPLLKELELLSFFEAVVSGDTLSVKKPDPMPLHHVCERFGLTAEQAVLVGDSVTDITAAQAAGMPVICVSYGYNQGMDLTKYRPDAIIDSFKELSSLIIPLET